MSNAFSTDSYLFGANSIFVEELYQRYLNRPDSVDPSWKEFFQSMGKNSQAFAEPSWKGRTTAVIGQQNEEDKPKSAAKTSAIDEKTLNQASAETVRALMLIHAYRVRGHLLANIDPLEMLDRGHHIELDAATYGFEGEMLDKPIHLGGVLGFDVATIREIMPILQQTYCGTIGYEYMHIQYPEQKDWIQKRIDTTAGHPKFDIEQKEKILDILVEIETFEEFLQVKYPGTKRFSIQGGDSAIAGLKAIIDTAVNLGVEDIAVGMPHRGRLNVLTTVMEKPYAEMFSLFHGNLDFPEWVDSSGDVKYHLGASTDIKTKEGNKAHMSLSANPSHLEVVNPVVAGKVRAKLHQMNDYKEKNKAMGILLHGDAAFAGQGSVPETISLSELRGYRTGGTVHIIVNNQIGFTTSPAYSRFTPYPSDVAKMVQAPIFHVNGDDPEAVVHACIMAAEFRQEFKRDVVVDVFCYRKYGHNESDEPMFTQPIMYKKIKAHDCPSKIYADQLIAEGTITAEQAEAKIQEHKDFFTKEYETGANFKPNKADWLEGHWAGFEKPKGEHPNGDTGVELKTLKEVGAVIAKEPEHIEVNRKLVRQLEAKRSMFKSGEGIDWATGEALAFGSLLKEGFKVRLSGQDCCRGTFSHRHSVLIDQNTEERFMPLRQLGEHERDIEILDSSLSELAVLGFEYGYSLAEPGCLTCWEGQFGDFANGAQVIIDQFIASGEAKWLRMSGLVMLLPHGYEGQGPEHSSARPERFLQLCAEDNMQVANCTTPANYFHILRRQLHRKFRKPLVMMTPKSLLRHKLAISSLKDMGPGTHFQRIIPEVDKIATDNAIKCVVICSGKVYYDLYEARKVGKIKDIAIIRMEQYYPFPARELKAELKKYKNAEIIWCQEEPKNMGAWFFVSPLIDEVIEDIGRTDRVGYRGRPAAASPAVGYLKIHNQEQETLVKEALTLQKQTRRKAS